jgi:hypothetical protein
MKKKLESSKEHTKNLMESSYSSSQKKPKKKTIISSSRKKQKYITNRKKITLQNQTLSPPKVSKSTLTIDKRKH